jgi:hypothetical protein
MFHLPDTHNRIHLASVQISGQDACAVNIFYLNTFAYWACYLYIKWTLRMDTNRLLNAAQQPIHSTRHIAEMWITQLRRHEPTAAHHVSFNHIPNRPTNKLLLQKLTVPFLIKRLPNFMKGSLPSSQKTADCPYLVCLFVFLALQPIVVVFSQPGNGL